MASKPKVNTVVNQAAILAFLIFCCMYPPIKFQVSFPELLSHRFATAESGKRRAEEHISNQSSLNYRVPGYWKFDFGR